MECSIRLSATHHPLCSDLHPSLPDGVHGIFFFKRLKLTRVRIKLMTSEYRSFDFWAMREAMRLVSLCMMGLAPPMVANIDGEKDPCSISTILS